MAHLATDSGNQLNIFSESNLIDSIINCLGGKEITGKEKMELQEEITRQEETRKKVQGWLSWYNRS